MRNEHIEVIKAMIDIRKRGLKRYAKRTRDDCPYFDREKVIGRIRAELSALQAALKSLSEK